MMVLIAHCAMKTFRRLPLLLLFIVFQSLSKEAPSRATELFKTFHERVFQIRVIDNISGKKSALGSGFSISANGLFATNYHVVSEVVVEPKRFRLEFVAADGHTGALKVLDVDVVHDLAIAVSDSVHASFFPLHDTTLRKGVHIFSMGNPLDLGMTIIEGTYNGLIEESLYEKILFSGSLNPGMSGGPGIDASGAVIGVNVSTAGNQLSFLVPAKYLRTLLDTVVRRNRHDTVNFTKRIELELYENQVSYMGRLLANEWKQDTLGHCLVPREMGTIFKCWGDTPHDSEVLYTVSTVNCASNDDIFLSSELTTGSIEFNYQWIETSHLGKDRFFHVLQSRSAEASVPNYEAKKEIGEPRCNTKFIRIGGADWKTTLCSWRYKKYPRLHDVVLKMALVSRNSQSMIIELQLLGVSMDMALAFSKKFMGALRWKD
jgi:serine protease Do